MYFIQTQIAHFIALQMCQRDFRKQSCLPDHIPNNEIFNKVMKEMHYNYYNRGYVPMKIYNLWVYANWILDSPLSLQNNMLKVAR